MLPHEFFPSGFVVSLPGIDQVRVGRVKVRYQFQVDTPRADGDFANVSTQDGVVGVVKQTLKASARQHVLTCCEEALCPYIEGVVVVVSARKAKIDNVLAAENGLVICPGGLDDHGHQLRR
jgi:hypothetical protein